MGNILNSLQLRIHSLQFESSKKMQKHDQTMTTNDLNNVQEDHETCIHSEIRYEIAMPRCTCI